MHHPVAAALELHSRVQVLSVLLVYIHCNIREPGGCVLQMLRHLLMVVFQILILTALVPIHSLNAMLLHHRHVLLHRLQVWDGFLG